MDIYEKMKKYQVQAESVEDFLQRYTKSARYQQRGPEYVAAVIQTSCEKMEKYRFTFISHHSSITGDVVAYYG